MDLKLFFSPVPDEVMTDLEDQHSFYKSIYIFREQMPAYKDSDLVLFGINEYRGSEDTQPMFSGPDQIRRKLYRLKKGSGSYRITDVGNLNPGHSQEETVLRIKEVCEYLLNHNIMPILLGGSHDLDLGQFLAYEGLEKLVSFLNIDALVDMKEHPSAASLNHTQQIILHQPNFLFNYLQLAYQSYLIDNDTLSALEKLCFETYRIGLIHHNIKEMEPVVREADLMSFDINAVKSSDAPGSVHAQPFGLTGEEACQLCWYAGMNEKLSSAGFYGYHPDLDDQNLKTAAVISTMIWYLIEGFYNRKDTLDYRSNDYLRYVVAMPVDPETLVFYKSKKSEKWWMEIGVPTNSQKHLRVPCSYSDYQMATKGEVPDRYINIQSRIF